MLAIVRRPDRRTHAALGRPPAQLHEDALIKLCAQTPDALVMILDCVQDPHNLGACLRTANAAGALAVIVPRDKSVSLTEVARHVAAGAAEVTPLVTVTNLARCLDRLKEAGLWLVGTTDRATDDFYALDLTGRIGLVLGAEGQGLRRLTAEKCDHLVQLPMLGTVECLNVSVAAGVCLYECVRQRLGIPSSADRGQAHGGFLVE
ncbi:MAG: 23S rRNA (guanosine(2251)-2'-O)-methyltransferase RlmB [Verrucomicrobiales bacterium]